MAERSVNLTDLEDQPFMKARWEEIVQHSIVINEAEWDEVDEGLLNLMLDESDAETWGIYPVLSLTPQGTVAEYNVNLPYQYMTFEQLLTAAAARTAAT